MQGYARICKVGISWNIRRCSFVGKGLVLKPHRISTAIHQPVFRGAVDPGGGDVPDGSLDARSMRNTVTLNSRWQTCLCACKHRDHGTDT